MARGNPAMKAKRVHGPTPNTVMVTRIREQELKAGGTLLYNPRTGKRSVIREFNPTTTPGTTIRHEHYH